MAEPRGVGGFEGSLSGGQEKQTGLAVGEDSEVPRPRAFIGLPRGSPSPGSRKRVRGGGGKPFPTAVRGKTSKGKRQEGMGRSASA